MERLVENLLARGVEVRVRDSNRTSWVGHLISWTPIVIMIAFLIFFMRQMQRPAAVSTLTRLRERQERRLEKKARFFEALATAKDGLFEDELLPLVPSGDNTPPDENEARKALYEMLSEGTVEMTEHTKYRLRTRS